MATMHERSIVVFGGTGFLGRRVVWRLRKAGFFVRVASRNPDRAHRLFGFDDPQLRSVEANIHDEQSIADALAGAYGVVNAVSLYVEHGRETFHSVHVEAAQRLADQARRAQVEQLAHVSGIGSDAGSSSLYIRKRGEGELAARAAFADTILIRPAVMFGPDDSFLTSILKLLGRLPIYPMFGCGLTSCSPRMWKMWRKQSLGRWIGRTCVRSPSSLADLASTLMKNCSGSLPTKPALSLC
ncbi:MAG: NAD(P)H-binding protein [Candidatus Binatia bacterium]